MKQRLALLILSIGLISKAQAHAFLDHAEPRVGSTSKTSPRIVRIWFTEELEPAFSDIRVFDSGKNEIDKHDAKVDPAIRTLMTVSLAAVGPGKYTVIWNAVAVDTHHTTGSFTFEIRP